MIENGSEIRIGSVAVIISIMIRNGTIPNGDRNLLQLDAGFEARMFLLANISQKELQQKLS